MADKELTAHLRITGENLAKQGLKNFGDEAAKAGDKVHDLGDETGFLGKRADEAEAKVKELIKTLNETGDTTLLKEIRKGKRELKLFEGLKKELEGDVRDPLVQIAQQAAKTGVKLNSLADNANFLKQQAAETEKRIRALIAALNTTGDLKLVESIRQARHELGLFNQLKTELEQMLKQSNGGGFLADIFGEGLTKGLGAAVARAGPVAMAVMAAVAVASSPFIGAAIATAVVGGTGLGGIVGGIALAAQDSRVKTAAEDLAGTAMAAFTSAGQEFVMPVIDALGTLERASQDIASKMGQGFAAIAPTLKPLTEGVVGFVSELVDDLVVAMDKAKPVIRAIANELPEIGDALGDFFGIIADDPDGAAMAMKNLSMIIQGTLRAAGHTIAVLSDIYVWSVKAVAATAGFLEGALGWMPIIGDWIESTKNRADNLISGLDAAKDASNDFAGGLSRVADEADRSAEELSNMKDAINDLFDKTMNLDEATAAYKRSIIDMREELKGAKKTLDDNTEAGLDNLDIIRNRINAIERMRDSEAESTLGLEEANERYAVRLEALKKDLLQMGFNKKAVEELIAKYLAVPNAVNVQLNLKMGGDAQAWSALRNFERKTEFTGHIGPGGFEERAVGGPTRAGRTYLVGERGPELWSEGANGFITPAAQTAAVLSGASGGATQPVFNFTLAASGATGLEAAIYAWLAERLRVDGGAIGQFKIPRIT